MRLAVSLSAISRMRLRRAVQQARMSKVEHRPAVSGETRPGEGHAPVLDGRHIERRA